MKVTVSLLLIFYVVYSAGPRQIFEQIRNVKVGFFLLSVFIATFNVAISAKKWQILLKAKNEMKGYLETWKVYYIGMFFNMFLPTNVGGDVVKAHKMSKKTKESVEAYSSVFMERFTGLIAVMLLALVSTTLYFEMIPFNVLLFVYCVFLPGMALVLLLLFKEGADEALEELMSRMLRDHNPFSIKEKVAKLHRSIQSYRKEGSALMKAIIISLLFQTLLIVNNYILALSLGIDISIKYFFIFIPICEVLLFLPISIRGFGWREFLYMLFFTQVGLLAEEAVSLSFLIQIPGILSSTIGGIVYIKSKTGEVT